MPKRVIIIALLGILASSWTASAASLAVIYADDSGSAPISAMVATGRFTSVVGIDVRSSTPTLSVLSGYDAVLAYTDYPPGDSTALGDVLSQYYALGGKALTIGTYGFSTPWGIGGAVMAGSDAGLLNLGSNSDVSGNLVATVPSDPIFNGIDLATISYFHNPNFANPGLADGATLLATDGAGIYMIARSADGIIDVNLFPAAFEGNNAEFYQLMAQSLGAPPSSIPEPASMGLLSAGLALLGVLARRKRSA